MISVESYEEYGKTKGSQDQVGEEEFAAVVLHFTRRDHAKECTCS